MAQGKRTSIKDIAHSVGVSTTLVSIVLNGKAEQYRISKDVAQKVIDVAQSLDYTPNVAARNLRVGKSQLIGLVITDISNPFYAAIARIIENRANELGYSVISSSSDDDPISANKSINLLLNKGVDGLIIIPCDGSREIIKKLHERNTPVVLVDRNFPDINVSFSCLNHYKATQIATQHLIDQGFENIGLIGYKTNMDHILDRIKGYEETMINAGLKKNIHVEKVNLADAQIEVQHTLEVLIENEKVDSIIFLTNMLTVIGLYHLKAMHVRIPEDVAIIGFNKNDVFNLFSSTITHIEQPLELIAKQSVNILVDKIQHGEQEIRSMILSEPQLIIGESSMQQKKR